jgi:hypothetical protein
MNNIPAWCRIAKVNYRVEVSQPGLSSNPKFIEKDLDNLADELNELFESHKNWSDTRAEATYDEAVLCQFCGNVYVPYYEEDRKDTVCDMCGKGKYEWAIEILEKSKGVTTNEDILS